MKRSVTKKKTLLLRQFLFCIIETSFQEIQLTLLKLLLIAKKPSLYVILPLNTKTLTRGVQFRRPPENLHSTPRDIKRRVI